MGASQKTFVTYSLTLCPPPPPPSCFFFSQGPYFINYFPTRACIFRLDNLPSHLAKEVSVDVDKMMIFASAKKNIVMSLNCL